MRKQILLVIAVFVILFAAANSFLIHNCMCQWVWQNPYPNSNDLLKLQFVNSNTAYICGAAGTICKTTNGGLNWINLHTPGYGEMHGISAINENIIYSAGENLLYKSTDGGTNWTYTLTGVGAFSTCFLNQYTGYVGGILSLAKTTNSGENFQIFNTGVNGSVNVLYYFNADTGIASGGGYNIQKTTNGGVSWFNTYSASGTGAFLDIAFVNNNTGFIVGTGGKIRKTTDAGNSWTTIPSGTTIELTGIAIKDSNIIVICGDAGGFIEYSTNGGSSWTQITTGNQHHYAMRYSPSGHLIAVGMSGSIIMSTNNGISWSAINSGIYNGTNESFFLNSGTGYVSCEGGLILKTTNSGNNWFSLSTGTGVSLNSIYFLNTLTGFAVGSSGIMIKTTNSGQNWYPLNTGISDGLFGVFFSNELTGYTGGTNLGIAKTTNGGLNWTDHFLNQGMINKIIFVNQNTGFSVTGTGKIMRTTNAGENWYSTFNNGSALYDINFPDVNTGYAPGQGSVLKTTNCGVNWIILPVIYSGFAPDFLDFADVNTGYAGGLIVPMSSSIVMIGKTTNGGLNWTVEYPGVKLNLSSISAPCADTCFLTGSLGAILRKTVNTTKVISKEKELPESFTLFQNYPNPFNSMTNVKWQMLNAGNAKIVVFDLLGREVATLVNEKLQPGMYEVRFDAGDLPSGIYFYQLQTNNPVVTGQVFTETKKLILLK